MESCDDSVVPGLKKVFADLSSMYTHCSRQGTLENELWLPGASGEGPTCWKAKRDDPAQGVGHAHPALM